MITIIGSCALSFRLQKYLRKETGYLKVIGFMLLFEVAVLILGAIRNRAQRLSTNLMTVITVVAILLLLTSIMAGWLLLTL